MRRVGRAVGRTGLRIWRWWDDRLGISRSIMPIVEHPVPPNLNWWYVLGSATLIAFVVQVVTGVALAFSYVPAPNSAYESLDFITHQAILGSVVRGLHYFGSSAMVVLIGAHAIHVFLTGSYKFPREVNWLTGVILLVLTLGMAFTGQLLRWNQDAYWAVVVGAEQAARAPIVGDFLARILVAGQIVGGATLTRFYATHVFLLPALMFMLIGVHLYLVIQHGVSEPPEPGRPVDPRTYRQWYDKLLHTVGVPFWPDAAWKDVVFALGVEAVVLALAVGIGPPELGDPADPTLINADPRPDWYFLWYFALLALLPAGVEDWVIIGFPLLVGVVLIALPFVAPAGERSPGRRPWAVAIVVLAIASMGALIELGLRAPWSPVLTMATLPPSLTDTLTGDAARGARLFQEEDCITCHQIAGSGGQRGPDLTFVGDRLTREQLTTRILTGGHNMPAYGQTLAPDEVDALVALLSERRSR
jgi:ubiquinol-cytochrome c reductase cytochrome b subunit